MTKRWGQAMGQDIKDTGQDASKATGKDTSQATGNGTGIDACGDGGRGTGGEVLRNGLRAELPADLPADLRDVLDDPHDDEPGAVAPGAETSRRRGRADHLERHAHGWRVRIRPPEALVACGLPSNLRITIGAATYQLAARAARAVRVEADRLFAEVEFMDEGKIEARLAAWRDEMKRVVATRLVETGRMFLTPEESARIDGHAWDREEGLEGCQEEGQEHERDSNPHDQEEPSLALDQLMRIAMADSWAEDLVGRALAGYRPEREALAPVREAGLRALGFETPEAAGACIPQIYRAWIESVRGQSAFHNGDPDVLAAALSPCDASALSPRDTSKKGRDGAEPPSGREAPAAAPVAAACATPLDTPLVAPLAATAFPPAPAPDDGSVSGDLFDDWDRFVEDMIDIRRDWKGSRRPELAGTRRVVTWLCGAIDRRSFSRPLLVAWQHAFLKLPHDYRMNPDFRQMSVAALIDWSKQRDCNRANNAEAREGYVRVSAKTFNKHLSTLKSYVLWLIRDEKLPEKAGEVFRGLHVSTKKHKSSSQERLRYTDDQVRALFASPVFLGRKYERYLTQPGPLVIRDSLYWSPLISAYHGMRREEICQLRVRHVREEYGIPYFDLNSPDLDLKVEAAKEDEGSRRRIPLHRDFLKLGFLEDKVMGRPGNAFLFEELDDQNAHEAFGDALGKRLGRYMRKLGMIGPDEKCGLHRLRHLFNTALVNTVENVAFVEALMGHSSDARKSERARYTDELFLKKLRETIDRLVLPIDVVALRESVERAAARPAHGPAGRPARPKRRRKGS